MPLQPHRGSGAPGIRVADGIQIVGAAELSRRPSRVPSRPYPSCSAAAASSSPQRAPGRPPRKANRLTRASPRWIASPSTSLSGNTQPLARRSRDQVVHVSRAQAGHFSRASKLPAVRRWRGRVARTLPHQQGPAGDAREARRRLRVHPRRRLDLLVCAPEELGRARTESNFLRAALRDAQVLYGRSRTLARAGPPRSRRRPLRSAGRPLEPRWVEVCTGDRAGPKTSLRSKAARTRFGLGSRPPLRRHARVGSRNWSRSS
jgi:hypothetical protein